MNIDVQKVLYTDWVSIKGSYYCYSYASPFPVYSRNDKPSKDIKKYCLKRVQLLVEILKNEKSLSYKGMNFSNERISGHKTVKCRGMG